MRNVQSKMVALIQCCLTTIMIALETLVKITDHFNVVHLLSFFLLHFLDGDINLDEQEEKARLIAQVMELQNTLDGEPISIPLLH